MRNLKIALLATAATVAFSSATFAADLIIADPIIDNTIGFDWEGPYAGLWISGQTEPSVFALGADLGVNVLVDSNLLAGLEGEIAWLSDDSWQGEVSGRLGFVSDAVLVYGHLGVGSNSDSGAYAPVGIGAEFGVMDNVSLRAEYTYQWDFDDSNESAHVGKIGFNWHF